MSVFIRARKDYSLLYGNMANEFLKYDDEGNPIVYMDADLEFTRAVIGDDGLESADAVFVYSVDLEVRKAITVNNISHGVAVAEHPKTISLLDSDGIVLAQRTISNNATLTVEVLAELKPATYTVLIESDEQIHYNYSNSTVNGDVFGMDTFYEDDEAFTGSLRLVVDYREVDV